MYSWAAAAPTTIIEQTEHKNCYKPKRCSGPLAHMVAVASATAAVAVAVRRYNAKPYLYCTHTQIHRGTHRETNAENAMRCAILFRLEWFSEISSIVIILYEIEFIWMGFSKDDFYWRFEILSTSDHRSAGANVYQRRFNIEFNSKTGYSKPEMLYGVHTCMRETQVIKQHATSFDISNNKNSVYSSCCSVPFIVESR